MCVRERERSGEAPDLLVKSLLVSDDLERHYLLFEVEALRSRAEGEGFQAFGIKG